MAKKKRARIMIQCTPEEMKQIREAAEKQARSLSSFCRLMILERLQQVAA